MNEGRLTVKIGGREALPVRAIPYVTCWKITPDDLAKQLARTVGAPFERLQNTCAYHLYSSQPALVLPKEWDAIIVKLAAFEAELRAKFLNDFQGYAAWRNDSAAILPEGVFVWVDEFEKDFHADFSPDQITFGIERPGDRDLNYTPMQIVEIRKVVLAGFEQDDATVAEKIEGVSVDDNQDEVLAALFDLVPVTSLEKMLPADGKWKSWAEKAKANGLIVARKERGLFNPYDAATWFLKKGVHGWDLARCNRVLVKNLPARSRDEAHLLTGDIN